MDAATNDPRAVEIPDENVSLTPNLYQLSSFVSCCRQLLPCIQEGFRQQSHRESLPVDVSLFLCSHLRMSYDDIGSLWSKYNKVVYDGSLDSFEYLLTGLHHSPSNISSLNKHGLCRRPVHYIPYRSLIKVISHLASLALEVDFDICPIGSCSRKLVYKPPIRGVLFTVRTGAVPVLCPSLYCNGMFEFPVGQLGH